MAIRSTTADLTPVAELEKAGILVQLFAMLKARISRAAAGADKAVWTATADSENTDISSFRGIL